jgi:hypothetical protein
LLLVLLLLGASVLLRPDPPDRPPLRVALIQADDHDLAWTEQLPDPLLRQLDLVVGPEGLLKDPEVVPFRGAALISGSVCPLRGDCRANRVDHRDAAGTLVHARNKSILVPWYEIEFLAGLGDRPPLTESLRIADTRIATAICYEIAHAGAMRAALADGPELLLNLTSDLWAGHRPRRSPADGDRPGPRRRVRSPRRPGFEPVLLERLFADWCRTVRLRALA